MNYINFSKSYHVRMLTERDIPLILALCEKNTQFYEHCPPFVTEESIRDDMCALPQRKMDEPQDKYYLGFFDDAEQLVAVMDFSESFWKKNQFTDTGLRNHTQDYTVVVMNRML